MLDRKLLTLAIALVLLVALLTLLPLDMELRTGLGILGFIAFLWVTETLHVTVTALLVPILAVVLGVFDLAEAMRNFAHPIIFLFLGGFALAAALHRQGLDMMIADRVLQLAGGNMRWAAVLLCLTAAFISMWISNTATVAMMLPLALGMLSHLPYEQYRSTYVFILLGIAYSANVGGIGTLVGTPPNAIAAQAAGLGFADWLQFGLPLVVIMLPIVLAILFLRLKPDLSHRFDLATADPQPLTGQQRLTLGIFALTVGGWLFSQPLSQWLGIDKGFDTWVALMAIVLLNVVRVVKWQDIQKTVDWGVLLLFGGGLTLSAVLKATGASIFLATGVKDLLAGAPLILFIAAITLFVMFLTEVASNTASTALLMPIFLSIAQAMGLDTTIMAVLIAVSASCAFMLPVATPPNAIVFGSGYVLQRDMMRVGIWMNFSMIALVSVLGWLLIA